MAKRRRVLNREFELAKADMSTALFDYYARQVLGDIKDDELLWCLHCEKANTGKAWSRARQCPTLGCDGGWRDCSRDHWWVGESVHFSPP